MRAFLSFLLLAALCNTLISCTNEPENGDPGITIVHPKLGSTYTYKWSRLDGNGNVLSQYSTEDTVTTVLNASASVMGKTGVTRFQSFGDFYNLVYGTNGDVLLYIESDEGPIPMWLTLPYGSKEQQTFTWDSTLLIEGDEIAIHSEGNISYAGSSEVQVGSSSYQTDKATLSTSIHMTSGNKSATMDITVHYHFSKVLGYFVKVEESQSGTDIDGHDENHGERWELISATVKQ